MVSANIGHRAGTLRHRLTIQDKDEPRSRRGGFNETWTTINTVWGSIGPLRGKEIEIAKQINPRASNKVIIRKGTRITETMRFKNDRSIYHFVSILNIDQRDWKLEIAVELATITGALLLENANFLLLETGGKLLLD